MRPLYALLVLLLAPAAAAQGPSTYTLAAPDGATVFVDRDGYGVPAISSDTEAALFFGQGFAVAQDRLFQMETFWRAATGRLAEIQGPSALAQDRAVRTVYYTPAERQAQFQALRPAVQTMVDSYVAGINAYIDSTETNPAEYLPAEYALGGFAPERWDRDRSVAVMQFFMRRFGEIGGDELARLAELDAQGADWFDANRPVNDASAETTIETGAAPALPDWSPRALADYPAGTAAFARAGAAAVAEQRATETAFLDALGVPARLGSFAATVAREQTENNGTLMLGAPQMGQPSATAKAVTSEVRLSGPLYLAGMTVPGIPGVIIGRTNDFAWTLTTGYTDNTDTYLEQLDASGQQYLYDGEFRPFEVFQETFGVAGGGTETDVHFRSVHGPVYFLDAAAGFAATWKYAFWNRELDMVEAFYDVWQAGGLAEFDAAGERVSMSFNVLYNDAEQNTAYWHVGRYPIRPGSADPRLPLVGTGQDEWLGTLPPDALPHQVNPASGVFANWNNKPAPWWNQGDNVPWTANPPGYVRPYDGVRFLKNHLSAAAPVSFDEMQELARVVRQNGTYNEYPGTYQQVVRFGVGCGTLARSENVVPPGQSGHLRLVDGQPTPGPHFADQWPLYQSSAGSGDVLMKPFPGFFACLSTPGDADGAGLGLGLPAPNPSAGTVALGLTLRAAATVRVAVYDALGRQVAVLADGPRTAGTTALTLDATALAPGVYVVRASADGRAASQRVVVTR